MINDLTKSLIIDIYDTDLFAFQRLRYGQGDMCLTALKVVQLTVTDFSSQIKQSAVAADDIRGGFLRIRQLRILADNDLNRIAARFGSHRL